MHEHMDKLMALHDGELSDDELRDVQALLERDPGAQRCLDMLTNADAAFAQSAAAMLSEPVPQRLVDTVRGTTQVSAQTAQILPFPRRKALVSLAVAAGLATILITGMPELRRNAPGQNSPPAFASLLQDTLETLPSGDIHSSDDGRIQITPLATYRHEDAGFCREYMARDGDRELEGLACREPSGGWAVVNQREFSTADGSRYRAAEGQESSAAASQLETAVSLSYAEEAAALESGWQRSAR
jgi:hypothetical protein